LPLSYLDPNIIKLQVLCDTFRSISRPSRSFTRTNGGDWRPDRDVPLSVQWYREGKLKLDELLTRRYSLEQINEAVNDLEYGRILGRANHHL
jgi:Zn-dependent alcohol dehydrogenase